MSFWTSHEVTPKRKSLFYVKISSKFFLPFVKTCSKPSANIETKEFKLVNHFIKYPGLVKWNPITITMVDMNGGNKRADIDTAIVLSRILTHSGYYFPNVNKHTYSLTGKDATGKNNLLTELTTPEKEKMAFGSFGPGLTKHYNEANSGIEIFQVNANGFIREHWVLKNPIVKSLKWGDLAYDTDEPVEYTLEIDYDWAELKEGSFASNVSIGREYQNFLFDLRQSDSIVAKENARLEREAAAAERAASIARSRAASAEEYGSGYGMGQGFDEELFTIQVQAEGALQDQNDSDAQNLDNPEEFDREPMDNEIFPGAPEEQ